MHYYEITIVTETAHLWVRCHGYTAFEAVAEAAKGITKDDGEVISVDVKEIR